MVEKEDVGEAYIALARSEPTEALDRLDEFLHLHRHSGARHGEAAIYRGAALAAWALADSDGSDRFVDLAISIAEEVGDDAGLVEAQLTKAGNLFLSGDVDGGIALMMGLDAGGSANLLAQINLQLGTMMARVGRTDESLVTLDRAEAAARSSGDRFLLAMTAKNRGMVRAQSGDCELAESDLHTASGLFEDLDLELERAFCDHNLGLIATYAGDLPRAFRFFERAESKIRELTGSDFESKSSHCRALLMAGLYAEAAVIAGTAADQCIAAGLLVDGAEARLLQSMALLQAGNASDAGSAARAAADLFAAQRRDPWQAVADLVLATASEDVDRDDSPIDRLAAIAARLEAGGLKRDALQATALLAEVRGRSDQDAGLALLDEIRPDLDRSTSDIKLVAATARASILDANGRGREAELEARGGYRLLAENQAALGATDIRAGVRQYASRLGTIGLGAVIAADDASAALEWLERISVTGNSPRPVVPRGDADYRAALAELRAIGPDDHERRRRLEDRVRTLARALKPGEGLPARPLPVAELRSHLGDVIGLAYGVHEDELLACVVGPAEVALHRLGRVGEVTRVARSLRADLRRRAVSPGRGNRDRILKAAGRLDDLLLEPLTLPDGPLIVSIPAGLFAVPWSGLPSRIGKSTSVVTSLTSWCMAEGRRPSGPTLVVAGPELDHAIGEARAVTGIRPDATQLLGEQASSAHILAGLETASIAHLICHGEVRTDNPLLSNLLVADGRMCVYEVEGVRDPPELVTLSACHLGLPAEEPGRELLGLATAMMAAGTAAVVASTLPVADSESTIDLMAAFHRNLLDGSGPAEALARLQRDDDRDLVLDSMTFTVFGRG